MVCFCTGIISPTFVGLGALILGVIRKGGMPKMSIDYGQLIMLDDNVQMIGFLMIASSAGSLAIICWGPIFIHAALVCSEIADNQDQIGGICKAVIAVVQKTGLTSKV